MASSFEGKSDGDTQQDMQRLLELQRAAHLCDGAPDIRTRIDRLDRCAALLKEYSADFERTISADFGNRSLNATAITDIMSPLGAIELNRKHLRDWMKPERRKVEPWLLGLLGARAEVRFQPKGVIGIIAPWNFPVGLVFSPVAGAVAAGNRILIKPSEFTPRTSDLIRVAVEKFFLPDEIAVVTGGPDVGAAFAALPFDHLVFTGATSIARHVMRAAADNLVPLTLELGGKSPVVIGSDADLATAAARIMAGKTLNAGQICLAPDYVLVQQSQEDELVDQLVNATCAMFPSLRDNPDYTSMISDRHFDRVRGYVDDAQTKGARIIEINPAGEDFSQQEHRRIAPTLILGANSEMAVMQDEIFGPVLPILSYGSIDEAIDIVNAQDRPLALYYFGNNHLEREHLVDRTTSGGVCINDVIMHCAQENLPFGGIGPSGMGAYHGIDGFREFSHRKSVYTQLSKDLQPMKGMRPPYGDKIRAFINRQIGI